MKPRTLTHEQEQKLATWIRENRASYQMNNACVRDGFKLLFPDKDPELNSSSISKYIGIAGLGKTSGPRGPRQPRAVNTDNDNSAVGAIREAEFQIQGALRLLDDERNGLQNRIIEIDNLTAKYRKV